MTDIWWNKHYKYRKQVLFDLTKGDLSGNFGRIYLPKSSVTNGKIRPDFLDIRIVFNGVSVIPPEHFLIQNSSDYVNIKFVYPQSPLTDYSQEVDDRCYIYYGDTFAESPEATLPLEPIPDIGDIAEDYTLGTLTDESFSQIIYLGQNDPRVGLTRPGEDWIFWENFIFTFKRRVGAKLSFDFYGDSIGLYAFPSPFQGTVDITIDDQTYKLDLCDLEVSDPDYELDPLVFTAKNLDDSMHTLTIENKGERSSNAIEIGIELFHEFYGPNAEELFSQEDVAEVIYLSAIVWSAYAVGQLSVEEAVDGFKWNSRIGGII